MQREQELIEKMLRTQLLWWHPETVSWAEQQFSWWNLRGSLTAVAGFHSSCHEGTDIKKQLRVKNLRGLLVSILGLWGRLQIAGREQESAAGVVNSH